MEERLRPASLAMPSTSSPGGGNGSRPGLPQRPEQSEVEELCEVAPSQPLLGGRGRKPPSSSSAATTRDNGGQQGWQKAAYGSRGSAQGFTIAAEAKAGQEEAGGEMAGFEVEAMEGGPPPYGAGVAGTLRRCDCRREKGPLLLAELAWSAVSMGKPGAAAWQGKHASIGGWAPSLLTGVWWLMNFFC
jgi:hypothetical protein